MGFPMAQELSLFAQRWGNVSSKDWSSDGRFAKFLAVMAINGNRLFMGRSSSV
jgi:hypothetical protein